jgi:hypothetical protein
MDDNHRVRLGGELIVYVEPAVEICAAAPAIHRKRGRCL